MTDYQLQFDLAMSMALEDADTQYEEMLKGNPTSAPKVSQSGSKKEYVILRKETFDLLVRETRPDKGPS